jgi:beta-barrel assembly-enhancing protease
MIVQFASKKELAVKIANNKSLLILILGLMPVLATPIEEPPTKDLPERIAAVSTLNRQIDQAVEKVTQEDWKAASPLLKAVIESPAFEYLPVERRHILLTSASGVALELEDFKQAQTYSVRACAMPNPTANDWLVRLYGSYGLNDMADAAEALTHIARQTPKTLADIKDPAIIRILRELKKSPTPAAQSFDLMAALYDANWELDGPIEPSSVWRDYALALLERGKIKEAKQVALRIRKPSVLISVRVDKRFDPIAAASPENFNIDKAVESEIAELREIVQKSPRSLQHVTELTYALLKARRYDEVLTLTDAATQRASDRSGKPAYDDAENLIWILNNRAIALGGLGRRDEELELLIRAARRPEHGNPNVSQAINLGDFYCELGRPKDALFAIIDVQDTSPYGRLQLESVRLCSALQLGDREAAATALDYIKEHQFDSPRTYQAALILAEDLDGAALLLIQRLKSGSLRSDALTEVQNYNDPQDLSWPAKWADRLRALLTRDDVRQAINKVGRIESFNLRSDLL